MDLGEQLRRGAAGAADAIATAREAFDLAGAAVTDGAWVRMALGAIPAPPAPAEEAWEYSLSALIRRHPKVPAKAGKPLSFLLDRLGALRFGPEGVALDGEDLSWPDIVRIDTIDARTALRTDALDREVDRIRDFLPPVPGRRRLLTRAGDLLLSVALVAIEDADRDADGLDAIQVPARVVHKGLFGREKTLPAGLFALSLLTHRSDVRASLLATAAAHDVPVAPAPAP